MVKFNKEKDKVTITINGVEEFMFMRKAMYNVFQTAACNSINKMDSDTLYFFNYLIQEMEPQINVQTLEIEGIEYK